MTDLQATDLSACRRATVADRTSETTLAGISWSLFHDCRSLFRNRWPSIWDLPSRDSFFRSLVNGNHHVNSVIDVGATTRVWEATIRRFWPGVDYRSLDIDRANAHDYYSFAEVDRQFNLVILTEVLEHVSPREAIDLLKSCFEVCRPGGLILVSVPNVLTPGYQLEFTHQTAYSHHDLPGAMNWAGFDVLDGWRLFHGGLKRRLIHKYILYPLHRALRVDYCQSIVMLGQRPS